MLNEGVITHNGYLINCLKKLGVVKYLAELVRMENIYKTFPGVKALTDVSFDLRKGELHAMLG